MILHSLPDITGNAAAHPLSTDDKQAKWIQFLADSANSANTRIGGPEVSISEGLVLAPGASMMLPPIAELMEFYVFNQTYYYLANGDKLYVLYGG